MGSHRANPNLARLTAAVKRLSPLLSQIAFVGGCVTGLLITDPAAGPLRTTLDVDAIVEIASYAEFARFENQLLGLGFQRDTAVICRWLADDLVLDLMPTDPYILGFSNRWYSPALKHARAIRLGDRDIRVATAPYFLATKLEAFRGRGNNDYQMSHDVDDVVTILDGRPEVVEEVSKSAADLRHYLSEEFRSLLVNRAFHDALPGHLLPDAASQQRITIVRSRIQQIIDL
jgi:predicted nucleotidyltransferase